MLQSFVHYAMHFLLIGGIAYLYDKTRWKQYWLILLATMLVDLDHLLADPIFDPDRCSVGYHLLHSYYATGIYALGVLLIKQPVIRLVFLGLLFHMFTDWVDCLWM